MAMNYNDPYRQYQSPSPGGNSLAPQPNTNPSSPTTSSNPSSGSGSSGSGSSGSGSQPRPATGASSSGGSTPSTGGSANIGGSTTQGARNATVYDPANPIRALRNALAARGIYNDSSPLMSYMMKFAPGLSNLFMLQGANGALGNDESAVSAGGLPTMFESFLNKALSGNGGLQSFMQTNGGYGQTQRLLELASQNLANYKQGGGGGNQFLDQLSGALGQSGGASDIISSLNAPFMGSYGRAYSQGLQSAEDRSANSEWLWQGDPNKTVFDSLLHQLYGRNYGRYAAPYGL